MGIKLEFLMTALPYHAGTTALFPDTQRAFINSMVARGQAKIVGSGEHPEDRGSNEEARLEGIEEPETADDQRRGGLAGSFRPAVETQEEADANRKAGEVIEAGKGAGGGPSAVGGSGAGHSATAGATAPATRTGAAAPVKK